MAKKKDEKIAETPEKPDVQAEQGQDEDEDLELQPEFEDGPVAPLVERAEAPQIRDARPGVVRHGRAGQDMTEAEMDQITNETARALAKQPKVQAMVPLDHRLPSDKPELQVETVCINGYVMQITRGEWVLVPETVGEILKGAGYMVAPAR